MPSSLPEAPLAGDVARGLLSPALPPIAFEVTVAAAQAATSDTSLSSLAWCGAPVTQLSMLTALDLTCSLLFEPLQDGTSGCPPFAVSLTGVTQDTAAAVRFDTGAPSEPLSSSLSIVDAASSFGLSINAQTTATTTTPLAADWCVASPPTWHGAFGLSLGTLVAAPSITLRGELRTSLVELGGGAALASARVQCSASARAALPTSCLEAAPPPAALTLLAGTVTAPANASAAAAPLPPLQALLLPFTAPRLLDVITLLPVKTMTTAAAASASPGASAAFASAAPRALQAVGTPSPTPAVPLLSLRSAWSGTRYNIYDAPLPTLNPLMPTPAPLSASASTVNVYMPLPACVVTWVQMRRPLIYATPSVSPSNWPGLPPGTVLDAGYNASSFLELSRSLMPHIILNEDVIAESMSISDARFATAALLEWAQAAFLNASRAARANFPTTSSQPFLVSVRPGARVSVLQTSDDPLYKPVYGGDVSSTPPTSVVTTTTTTTAGTGTTTSFTTTPRTPALDAAAVTARLFSRRRLEATSTTQSDAAIADALWSSWAKDVVVGNTVCPPVAGTALGYGASPLLFTVPATPELAAALAQPAPLPIRIRQGVRDPAAFRYAWDITTRAIGSGASATSADVFRAVVAVVASGTFMPADVACPPFCPGVLETLVGPPTAVTASGAVASPVPSTPSSSSSSSATGRSIYEVLGLSVGLVAQAPAATTPSVVSPGGPSSSSSSSATVVTNEFVGGVRSAGTCVADGYADPLEVDCTDPSSAAASLCAYQNPRTRTCSTCPRGAVCPSEYEVRALPGYFVVKNPASGDVAALACDAPSTERCTGYQPLVGPSSCGTGYSTLLPGCITCASGYYTATSGGCLPCPTASFSPFSWAVLRPVIVFVGVALGIASGIAAPIVFMARKQSLPLKSALITALVFISSCVLVFQSVAQVASTMRNIAAVPSDVRGFLSLFRVFALQSIGTVSPECTLRDGTSPFLWLQVFSCGLIAFGAVLAAGALYCQRRLNREARHVIIGAAAAKLPGGAGMHDPTSSATGSNAALANPLFKVGPGGHAHLHHSAHTHSPLFALKSHLEAGAGEDHRRERAGVVALFGRSARPAGAEAAIAAWEAEATSSAAPRLRALLAASLPPQLLDAPAASPAAATALPVAAAPSSPAAAAAAEAAVPRLLRKTAPSLVSAGILLLTLAYSFMSNTIFETLHCEETTITRSAYLALLARSAGADAVLSDTAYVSSRSPLSSLVTVSVMAARPGVLCGVGYHATARAIAIAALCLYLLLFPAVVFVWVSWASLPYWPLASAATSKAAGGRGSASNAGRRVRSCHPFLPASWLRPSATNSTLGRALLRACVCCRARQAPPPPLVDLFLDDASLDCFPRLPCLPRRIGAATPARSRYDARKSLQALQFVVPLPAPLLLCSGRFLLSDYRPSRYWVHVTNLLARLLLGLVRVFTAHSPAATAAAASIAVMVAQACLLAAARPFRKDLTWSNGLHVLGIVVSCLVVLLDALTDGLNANAAYNADDSESTPGLRAVGGLIMAGTAAMLLTIAAALWNEVRPEVRQRAIVAAIVRSIEEPMRREAAAVAAAAAASSRQLAVAPTRPLEAGGATPAAAAAAAAHGGAVPAVAVVNPMAAAAAAVAAVSADKASGGAALVPVPTPAPVASKHTPASASPAAASGGGAKLTRQASTLSTSSGAAKSARRVGGPSAATTFSPTSAGGSGGLSSRSLSGAASPARATSKRTVLASPSTPSSPAAAAVAVTASPAAAGAASPTLKRPASFLRAASSAEAGGGGARGKLTRVAMSSSRDIASRGAGVDSAAAVYSRGVTAADTSDRDLNLGAVRIRIAGERPAGGHDGGGGRAVVAAARGGGASARRMGSAGASGRTLGGGATSITVGPAAAAATRGASSAAAAAAPASPSARRLGAAAASPSSPSHGPAAPLASVERNPSARLLSGYAPSQSKRRLGQ